MTVSENVVPGGPGHSKHHNDLAKQGNELEQIVKTGRLSEAGLSTAIVQPPAASPRGGRGHSSFRAAYLVDATKAHRGTVQREGCAVSASHRKWIGHLVIVGVVVGMGTLILGPQFAEQDKRNKMRDVCTASVAEWAGVDTASLEWEDVSSENFSGAAWDFRGSYAGGTWACGGPAGGSEPAQVIVYPRVGVGQDITP